jgi:glucoside 3-dehydrogenase (cytochrome c) hitch-hiker subunit
MERRDALRVLGAAAAFVILPRDAAAAWKRVSKGFRPENGLTDAQLALVGLIADTILPKTDSPSATEVGVPAFVNVIVSENYTDQERTAFLAGLDAIGAQLTASASDAFTLIQNLESAERRTDPARTYWRLKGLIIHGYFTSEQVQKNVLKVNIMPGRFDGAAPMPERRHA